MFFVISFFLLNAYKHSEKKCLSRTLLWMEGSRSLKNTQRYPSKSVTQTLLFSCSVVSDSFLPHGLQHTMHCPSPSPRACSDSCPLSQWCHPTVSSSVVPFSPCPQSFPASGSFLMSRFFISGGQTIVASAPVPPMNIQDWFPLGLTGLISLQFKGLSRVFSNTQMTQMSTAFSSVPLAVLHLRVKHANETSLSIMWQTPAAEWEKYIISLIDRDLLLIHKSLPRDAKEFTFTDLVPGRKYIATVTSISGDLKNSSLTKGRTGNILK